MGKLRGLKKDLSAAGCPFLPAAHDGRLLFFASLFFISFFLLLWRRWRRRGCLLLLGRLYFLDVVLDIVAYCDEQDHENRYEYNPPVLENLHDKRNKGDFFHTVNIGSLEPNIYKRRAEGYTVAMKRICIVTGASSGMGDCFARQLAQEGRESFDELWIVARRADRLEQLKAVIEQGPAGPGGCPAVVALPFDLAGKAGALRLKERLDEEQGKGAFTVCVLVNNAGFGSYGEFADTDPEREMDMVDLDCTSLTGITGYALPFMERGARIINTASLASFLPLGNFAVYGACKAYVLSFTVALRAELKDRGIRVTALCPGPVSTEFADVASKGARKEVRHGLSAEKTVAHCLKQSRKGRLYAIMAFKWKFKAAASRFVGRYAGAWFTWRFCKRPSN